MAARPQLSNLKTVNLAPKVKNHANLLPHFTANEVSCDVKNVLSSVPNGIRRVICCEMPVKGLDCELEDIETTDVFHIHELIRTRLRAIPIQQSLKVGTEYVLRAKNDSHEILTVYSKEFSNSRQSFNGNIPLFTLAAGCQITIKCKIIEQYGYVRGYGAFVMGVNTRSCAAEPIDGASSNSKCTSWKLSFINNGTATGQHIVSTAIGCILARLRALDADYIADNLVTESNDHVLGVPNENDTIGALIMQHALEYFPSECKFITCNVTAEKVLVFRIRADNPKEILLTTIKNLIDIYRQLNTL